MSIDWPVNSKVRFTQERLAVLTPHDRQGLAGRIGVAQTDSRFIVKPTIYFPATGDKPELRLFRVDPRHLELVEIPPEALSPPSADDGTKPSEFTNRMHEVQPASTEGGGNLSQSELDNFFD
jgi:hypothetical protein